MKNYWLIQKKFNDKFDGGDIYNSRLVSSLRSINYKVKVIEINDYFHLLPCTKKIGKHDLKS